MTNYEITTNNQIPKWSFKIGAYFVILISSLVLLSSCGDLETALSSLAVSPSSSTVGISQSKTFTIVAYDSNGLVTSASPSWSVTGGIGSISSNGLFTAGSSTGTGTVVASSGGVSGSAAITITDKCWVEGKVTGAQDAGGVENILISIDGTSLTDRTDSNGEYSISNISAGTYNVFTQTDHQIYSSGSTEVTLSAGETKTVNFYLTVRDGVVQLPTTTVFSFSVPTTTIPLF